MGVDVFPGMAREKWDYVTGDVSSHLPVEEGSFDVVVAGEIIEHVPNPDLLLREIRRALRPGGTLIVSTPNLVSWANRLLVPLGVQPLGTETSSEVALAACSGKVATPTDALSFSDRSRSWRNWRRRKAVRIRSEMVTALVELVPMSRMANSSPP